MLHFSHERIRTIRIVSIAISKKKGTRKTPMEEAVLLAQNPGGHSIQAWRAGYGRNHSTWQGMP